MAKSETKMGRDELAETLVNESYEFAIDAKLAKIITKQLFANLGEALRDYGAVDIFGFGKFSVSHVAEHQGTNPQTGQKITVAAKNAPKFKPGKALKELVNS